MGRARAELATALAAAFFGLGLGYLFFLPMAGKLKRRSEEELLVKEIVIPAGVDRPVFFLAPMLSFVLAILAWAVIPFDKGWVLADINVAILFVFAASSLEVYGVVVAGWASNSKYSFLGAMRASGPLRSTVYSLLGQVCVAPAMSRYWMALTDCTGPNSRDRKSVV